MGALAELVSEALRLHAGAAACEPRLGAEIEKLLSEGIPQTQVVEFTKEQRNSIYQQYGLNQAQIQSVAYLQELGFLHEEAMQAYLACNKDQEMAANLLLELRFNDGTLAAQAGPGQSAAPVANMNDLSFSVREWEAICRIEALGFDRQTSVAAFLNCGKDEEAAGNHLLN